MNKIYGDKDTIKEARAAKPGDPISYVNWEAIDELPDEFESRIEKVKFNIDKDFDLTGDDMYYPHPDLMNRIAEKRGISGTLNSIIEPIIQDININPLLCKRLEDPPIIQKTVLGMRETKVGYTLEIDGTRKPCLPCTVDFNAWNRCVKAWSSEEEKTNGYDKSIEKTMDNGNVYYNMEYYDKKEKKKKSYKLFPKYNTKYKRNAHFEDLKLFDQRNADTKSKNVVIRTIVGMPTGFSKEDLKEGYFIVYRICRSREILKLESAAHLTRISQGGEPSPAANLLFGPEDEAIVVDEPAIIISTDAIVIEPTPEEELLGIFQSYVNLKELPDDEKRTAENVIRFLESNPDKDDSYDRLYKKVIAG